jgi:hypothetical protein
MFWRDQEHWYRPVVNEWAKAIGLIATLAPLQVIKGALGPVLPTLRLRLQEEDHIAHVPGEAPGVDVLNNLLKNGVYRKEKWVHHCTRPIFARPGGKEAPAPKRSLFINKTLVTIEKRTGP